MTHGSRTMTHREKTSNQKESLWDRITTFMAIVTDAIKKPKNTKGKATTPTPTEEPNTRRSDWDKILDEVYEEILPELKKGEQEVREYHQRRLEAEEKAEAQEKTTER